MEEKKYLEMGSELRLNSSELEGLANLLDLATNISVGDAEIDRMEIEAGGFELTVSEEDFDTEEITVRRVKRILPVSSETEKAN